MFCPECGNDAGEAKFCPECGTQLDQVRAAVKSPRTTGARARKAPRAATADAAPVAVQAPARRPRVGMKPLYLWLGVLGVAIVAAILVVVFTSQVVVLVVVGGTVDVSGSYSVLVTRANTITTRASSTCRAATWRRPPSTTRRSPRSTGRRGRSRRPTRPSAPTTRRRCSTPVTCRARSQVDQALKLKPTGEILQNALLNKGNFVAMAARVDQQGQRATGQKLLAQAKASTRRRSRSTPGTATAKQAQSEITTVSPVTPTAAVSTSP